MPIDQWPLTFIYDLLEVEAKQMMMMTSYQDVQTMVTTCHPGRGEKKAITHCRVLSIILQLTGGGLPLQQGPRHAELLVVTSRGCPTVYGHRLARQVWMGTTGTPMSMGLQPPMTLHPSTSKPRRSRLGTPVPSPSPLPGQTWSVPRHLSTFLPAFPRYGLDRCELQDRDHNSIAAMVSMGEEEIEESDVRRPACVEAPALPRGHSSYTAA